MSCPFVTSAFLPGYFSVADLIARSHVFLPFIMPSVLWFGAWHRTLYLVGYFCILINILELCSEMQLNYLEQLDSS